MRPASTPRLLTVATVSLVLLSCAYAGPAGAACVPLLSDPVGDAVSVDGADDLVSADLASDSRTFTAVVRFAGDVRAQTAGPGHAVQTQFVAGGEQLWNLTTSFTAFGAARTYLQRVDGVEVPFVDGRGTVSGDGRTVTQRFSLSAFGTLGLPLARGTRVSQVQVRTERTLPIPTGAAVFVPADLDTAATTRTYSLGARSCIRP